MTYPEPVRFIGFSEWIQSALGVDTFTSEILAVMVLIIVFFIPMILIKTAHYVIAIMGILLLAVATGIGWLPSWSWTIICVFIAIRFAQRLKGGF